MVGPDEARVGTAGTSFRKEAASSASCSARQQQMHSDACLAAREGLRLLEDVSFDLGKRLSRTSATEHSPKSS